MNIQYIPQNLHSFVIVCAVVVTSQTLVVPCHYSDVIMSTMASQITSHTIVYSTVYSGIDQRKHQSSTSLAFVRGIHRWPVNSPHKGPVTRKMFPFDDVIIWFIYPHSSYFTGTWANQWLPYCQCHNNEELGYQLVTKHNWKVKYRKTSNISRTLLGYKIVDHSDVVGASPVGAAPTTSSLST